MAITPFLTFLTEVSAYLTMGKFLKQKSISNHGLQEETGYERRQASNVKTAVLQFMLEAA